MVPRPNQLSYGELLGMGEECEYYDVYMVFTFFDFLGKAAHCSSRNTNDIKVCIIKDYLIIVTGGADWCITSY